MIFDMVDKLLVTNNYRFSHIGFRSVSDTKFHLMLLDGVNAVKLYVMNESRPALSLNTNE